MIPAANRIKLKYALYEAFLLAFVYTVAKASRRVLETSLQEGCGQN